MVKRKPRALTRDTRQTGSSDMARDRKRKALAPGKRRAKSGKIYYENRKNRSDVKGRDTPTTKRKRVVKGLKANSSMGDKSISNRKKSILKSVKKLDKTLIGIKKNKIPLRNRLNKKPVPIHNKNGVAKEIMRQLGKPTLFMLGANRFVADGDSLIFFIKGSRQINRIKITLNGRDLYDVEFWKQSPTKFTVKVVKRVKDVYFDMLREVIERNTGLATTMPMVRFR